MLLKSLQLKNFLSFGDDGAAIQLRPLNVIIGANGSGKSNFIEAIDLIRSTPSTSNRSNLLAAIRDGGGVRDWIWKGGWNGLLEQALTPSSVIPKDQRICATC